MNFYFCEGCGKRLTEADLELGAGRDKKLRGVYCRDCAVGVVTMETLPLSKESARQILDQSPAFPFPDSGSKRKSSQLKIPAAGRALKGSREERSWPQQRVTQKFLSGSKGTAITAAAAGALFASFIGYLFLQGPSPMAVSHEKPALKPAPNTLPLSQGSRNIPLAVPGAEEPMQRPASPPAVHAKAGEPVKAPRISPQLTAAPQGFKPLSPSVAEPNPQSVPPETRLGLAEVRGSREAVATASRPAEPIRDERARARRVELLAILEALKEQGPLAADVVAKRADGQAGSDSAWDTLTGVLVREAEQRLAAVRRFQGATVAWRVGEKQLRGRLIRVEEDKATIQQEYTINGQLRQGKEISFPLQHIAVQTWAAILPRPAPGTPEELLAGVLAMLAAGRVEEAHQAVGSVAAHAALEAIKEFTRERFEAQRDEAAESGWRELLANLEPPPDPGKAKKLLGTLKGFEQRFAGARLLETQRVELGRIRERLEDTAAGLEGSLRELFKGQVKALDPRRRRISIAYDFSDERQLADFEGSKGFSITIPGTLRGPSSNFEPSQGLWLPQYDPGEVRVEFDYRISDWGRGSGLQTHLAVFFGTEEFAANSLIRASLVVIRMNPVGIDLADSFASFARQFGVYSKRPPDSGTLLLESSGGRIRASLGGTQVLTYALPREKLAKGYSGLCFTSGFGLQFELTRLVIQGRLHGKWLKAKLPTEVLAQIPDLDSMTTGSLSGP